MTNTLRLLAIAKSLTEKAGARHSSKDTDMVQRMHDLACELGAKCDVKKATGDYFSQPAMKAGVADALVLRHPGHGNQKVHGNRFGAGQAKESLRRLKDDKEAREKYKEAHRKKTSASRKQNEDDTNTQLEINKLVDKQNLLRRQVDTENLQPKYRKEKLAEIEKIDQSLGDLKLKKVREGSFIKGKNTSFTGLVTGKGTMKVGKETIPVFKVIGPRGQSSVIPVKETEIIAL